MQNRYFYQRMKHFVEELSCRYFGQPFNIWTTSAMEDDIRREVKTQYPLFYENAHIAGRGTICNTMENFENFVQEGLQNGFPQLYRYIYKDYRGNIRINKNVFKHAEEVVQYLPFILKLDECTEYGIYFGNTLAETFEFTRDNSRCTCNITIRPLYESKRAEITFMFADREEGNTHDEQKPD